MASGNQPAAGRGGLQRAPGWWQGGPAGLVTWLALPMLLFLSLPILTVIAQSLITDMTAPELPMSQIRSALLLSLRTSGMATLLALALGTPLALALARGYFSPVLTRIMMILVEIPLVLPPVVAGVSLLLVFGRYGWLGLMLSRLNIAVAFTGTAVVMAQMLVASPLYIRSAVLGFAQVDREVENASSLDGASFWQTLRHITLPLSRSALLTGIVMTWARAVGEFGATLIFAGNFPGRTQTMPVVIYLGFEIDLTVSLVLSGILLGVSIAVLTAMHLTQNRLLQPM